MKQLILILFLLSINLSHAGIFLEPYVGYEMKPFEKTDSDANQTVEFTTTGYNFGAKIGFTGKRFFLFVDGNYSLITSGDYSEDGAVNFTGGAASNMRVGANLGFKIKKWGRVYAGMDFIDKLTFTENWVSTSGLTIRQKDDFYTGNNLHAGLSVIIKKKVAINVEYHIVAYTSTTYEGTSYSAIPSNWDITSSAIIANISMPLRFFKK